MEEIITKETAKKLMQIEGETRGLSIRGDIEYVIYKKGEAGLRKLEEEMTKLGCPLKYKEIRQMEFYPVGLELIVFLVIKKIFNFNKEDFFEMGEFNSKLSLIIRLFMKYFVSVETLAKEASKIWKTYYTVGEFEVVDVSGEKRRGILRLRNFRLLRAHCHTVRGYLSNTVKMVVKEPVTCEETKCPFLGDKYHEFLLKW